MKQTLHELCSHPPGNLALHSVLNETCDAFYKRLVFGGNLTLFVEHLVAMCRRLDAVNSNISFLWWLWGLLVVGVLLGIRFCVPTRGASDQHRGLRLFARHDEDHATLQDASQQLDLTIQKSMQEISSLDRELKIMEAEQRKEGTAFEQNQGTSIPVRPLSSGGKLGKMVLHARRFQNKAEGLK
jgi:hypothetical protein